MLTKRAKTTIYSLLGLFLLFLFYAMINYYIVSSTYMFNYNGDIKEVGEFQTALVLGAKVNNDGSLSSILNDRAQTTLELYQNGRVKKILVSGDHGTTEYDEVNAMKKYFIDNGVPAEDIFMDHAGFDTYDSLYRAKNIFHVESLLVITQKFHLPRATFIARKLGLDAMGFPADKHIYTGATRLEFRESLARIKAFFSILFNTEPKFLGEAIPITGDSRLSWD